jgi:diphthamide synthase subunit DPH2
MHVIKLKNFLNESLDHNQQEMVDGIIGILVQVKDEQNRLEIAQKMLKQFKDENIPVDSKWFVNKCNLPTE